MLSETKPSKQLVVMAWLAAHPGSTARDVATMLTGGPPSHSEHTNAYVVLRSLRDRGDIERIDGSFPQRWRVAEAPVEPLGEQIAEVYPGADDPIPVRRVDVERCAHLLRAFLRLGGVGEPTRELICRLEHCLRKETQR
jgi:hypothetical protein